MKNVKIIFILFLCLNTISSCYDDNTKASKKEEIIYLTTLPHGIYKPKDVQLEKKIINNLEEYFNDLEEIIDDYYKKQLLMKIFTILSWLEKGVKNKSLDKNKVISFCNSFYQKIEKLDLEQNINSRRLGFIQSIGNIPIDNAITFSMSEIAKQESCSNFDSNLFYLSKVCKKDKKRVESIKRILNSKKNYKDYCLGLFEKWLKL